MQTFAEHQIITTLLICFDIENKIYLIGVVT